MFRLSLLFLIVAIIAGIFGFGGIAEGAAYFAKIVFFIAIALLVINLIFGGFKRVE